MPSSSKKRRPPAGKPKRPRVSRPIRPKTRPKAKAPARRPVPAAKAKPVPAAKGRAKPEPARAPATPAMPVEPALTVGGDGRRHVLSLSFLRDGDEFLARLETDSGQITELKNRSLDQLLTLVASELEDLLE
jgi:hypothetical protein